MLTTIDACQIHFDISLNFDLTKNYLELITTYVSLMILLSKVDDRKTVLGLFTIAHEMVHGQGYIYLYVEEIICEIMYNYSSHYYSKVMPAFLASAK